MGEEQKKPDEKQAEEKKPVEAKRPEEGKMEELPKAEKPSDDNKEEKKAEESKDSKEAPPPQEIVLKVYMHCEACARKVRRCLKGFEGVEEIHTDCKSHKVVVKGEKADPLKVRERVQKKSHRQVELLSPIPKPKPQEPKKVEEKEIPKPQEKKEEPRVISVVLQVHMHCDACAQEIKKRIQKMNGVENAEPDLNSSQVTVRGAFEPQQLVEFVHRRTGRQAVILKVDPGKKEDDKSKERKGGEENVAKEGGDKEKKPEGGENKEKKDSSGGGAEESAKAEEVGNEEPKVEVKKNEFYYPYPQNFQIYPQGYAQDLYAFPAYPASPAYPAYPAYPASPPQFFSDENPNACSVM